MKVCIVGSAESSISLAPFQDPEWEIWSCSPTMRLLPRIGVAFELHKYDRTVEPFSPEYVSWLNDFDGIVWMMAEYPQVKNCEVIPYKALMKKYSPYFFTSSIAWMMALAIEVADEISLYGVDMAASTEYYDQKMGCQFFAQIAKKKGIKVSVPPESDLFCPPPLYGVREYSHEWIKQTCRERELAQRRNASDASIQSGKVEFQFSRGALDNQDYMVKTWLTKRDEQEYCTVPKVEVL